MKCIHCLNLKHINCYRKFTKYPHPYAYMCIPVIVRHNCSDMAFMFFAEEVEIRSGVVKNMLMSKRFAPTTSIEKLLSTDIFVN